MRRAAPLEVAAREIELRGLDGSAFTLATPAGTARVELALPGLYNVYNATAAGGDRARRSARRSRRSPPASGGSSPPSAASSGSTIGDRRLLMLLIKNPAGANEAVRTLLDGSPPRLAVVALNDDIADGRDVSWIWDVDFEPLLAGLEHVVVSGGRAAELALRFAYGGLDRRPDRGRSRTSRPALDRGLELTRAGRRARRAPDLHGDARGCARSSRGRGLVPDFWERPA